MRKRRSEGDDGRVIASMNVEGMPWHSPRTESPQEGEKIELTKAEKRAMLWGVLKASFLVLGIFALCFALFILFCDYIWLR